MYSSIHFAIGLSPLASPNDAFTLSLNSMSPVTVPPDLGKAALAVVVVEVKTASLAAMSTPSTVPETTMFPVVSVPVLVVSNFFDPL
mgnify:CR=1 FL=1